MWSAVLLQQVVHAVQAVKERKNNSASWRFAFFLSFCNAFQLYSLCSVWLCNVYYSFGVFSCKARYCSNFINFYISEANSHSPLPGQQIPLPSVRFRCIEPRWWRDSLLYQRECLFSILPLYNWEINDDSALTRSWNIYWLLRIFDASYWRQYIVKVILLCWPRCTVCCYWKVNCADWN